MKTSNKHIAAIALSGFLVSTPVLAEDWTGDAKDAWIDRQVEMSIAMNDSLNDYEISSVVKSGQVTLTGLVPTDEQRLEAGSVAMNIDGVTDVDNRIEVDRDLMPDDHEASL